MLCTGARYGIRRCQTPLGYSTNGYLVKKILFLGFLGRL